MQYQQYQQYFNPQNYAPQFLSPQNYAPQFFSPQNITQQLDKVQAEPSKKVETINETIILEKANTDFNVMYNDYNITDNALTYYETYPIASVLYKKIKDCGENTENIGQYIDMNNSDCKTFRLNDRIKINNKKIKELEDNIKVYEKAVNKYIEDARQEIKDNEKKKEEKSYADYLYFKQKVLEGINILVDKTTGTIYVGVDKTLDFIRIFCNRWSAPFGGFVIFIIIVVVVYFGFSTKRNRNNNIGTGQQSTTSNNIFDYNGNFLTSFSNDLSLFMGDISLFAKNVDDSVKSLTEVLPDDIARENDENSRGADNLYHFNGKDLNIANKVDNYNVNAVYSIYKPTNIIQKNFEIQWKKVKDVNKNESKYVLDCQGDDKKDYLEPNCSVKIKPIIEPEPIEQEKEIYIKPI